MNDDFRIVAGNLCGYYGRGGDVKLPEGITVISNNILKNFTSAVIPDSVTLIGLQNNSALQRLVIGAGVTNLRSGIFQNCKDLKSVVIGPNVKTIGADGFFDIGVFSGCSSLETVVLGNNVEKIAAMTFMGCKSLKRIVIPKSVTWIGKDAFLSCHKDLVIYCRAEEHEVNWHKKWGRFHKIVWGYNN